MAWAVLRGLPGSNAALALSCLRANGLSTFSLADAARLSVAPRTKTSTWGIILGHRVIGLASATQRSGPQSWEITHLSLASDAPTLLPELLERTCQAVGSEGGQRVFLRLKRDDPIADVARRSGFFPCVLEVLYKGLKGSIGRDLHHNSQHKSGSVRDKSRADEYGLFRLYNASTPPVVRKVVGMGFDQWRASQEPGGSSRHELVYEKDGALWGWVKSTRRGKTGLLEVAVHPESEWCLSGLLDPALENLTGVNAVYCMVSEHQFGVQRVLSQKGFEAATEYITLVKSMAVHARDDARAAATIASS